MVAKVELANTSALPVQWELQKWVWGCGGVGVCGGGCLCAACAVEAAEVGGACGGGGSVYGGVCVGVWGVGGGGVVGVGI